MIIVDLEGTLTCILWRGKWSKSVNEEFNMKLREDPPNNTMLGNLDRWYKEHFIVILTAKEERFRGMTEVWLSQHNVKYDRLIMKPDDLHGVNSPEWKSIAISQMPSHESVHLFVDDREDVIEHMQDHFDFPCMLVSRT